MQNDIFMIYNVFKFRINSLLYRISQKFKSKDRVIRDSCYLDQCSIYNDEVISLQDRLIYIDYNNSKSITYKNIFDMLAENETAKAEALNAILIKIKLELFAKFPTYITYIHLDDPYKLKYSAYVFPIEQFVKVFTEPGNHEKYIKYIQDGIGLRYAGTKQHSPSLSHYICVQLINNGKSVEQNEVIELYSNFSSVLAILGKQSTSKFELMSLIPANINVLNEAQTKITKVLLGDNLLEDHLEIHEFLNNWITENPNRHTPESLIVFSYWSVG